MSPASMEWYHALAKPSSTPAPATIGLIWQFLYPLIVASFGFVFVQDSRRKLPWLVALPFAINLVANRIFTTILFGLRNLLLASAGILVVWGTIVWCVVAVGRHNRGVAVAQAPYFVWVSSATVLQVDRHGNELVTLEPMRHQIGEGTGQFRHDHGERHRRLL